MKYSDFNEKEQHGSIDFPIEYYYVTPAHSQYEMQIHWHKEFEIVRVLEGTFTAFIDTIKYEMNEGDILFVGCGSLHSGIPFDCIYECVVFDINMLLKHHNDIASKFLKPLINSTSIIKGYLKNDGDTELSKIIDEIFSILKNSEEFSEMLIYSVLYKFFYHIFNNNYILDTKLLTNKVHNQIKTLHELIDWIESNYSSNITLEDLAKVSGMSPKYLCHFFKLYTSHTPIDYVNFYRIECACNELKTNDFSITDIAFRCGFNDLSYFIKTFKKYKGVSPKQYIKQVATNKKL
ncbi:MAG: AraC family transcriptional regulator [Oscillospiraceae bacterium]|nr:AraC family transcriptional regulator [Oscillospiraceae bacterium]